MKWTTFLPFLLLIWLTNCTERAALSGQLQLTQDGHWADQIYLIHPQNLDEVARPFTGQILDSAQILADGSFTFESLPDSDQPMVLELAVQQKGERYLNRLKNEDLSTDNYFPVVWKNGFHLRIEAEIAHFQQSFSIKNPSPENAALLKLRDIRQAAFDQFLGKNVEEEHEEALLLEEEAAQLAFQQSMMEFADQTELLLPAMVALRWVSPDDDFERIPEFLVAQCQKWQSMEPDHPWVAQLCERSDPQQLPVLKGAQVPDARLPMHSGDTLAFYQLLGERLTILDFWASWCAPCRKENKEILVPLWEKYHESGFEIVGYALEAWEKGWSAAIEKDGAYRWKHASHLTGDDAPFLEILRIQTIPANFILDEKGTVLAKNLHGEELVEFVEGYFDGKKTK